MDGQQLFLFPEFNKPAVPYPEVPEEVQRLFLHNTKNKICRGELRLMMCTGGTSGLFIAGKFYWVADIESRYLNGRKDLIAYPLTGSASYWATKSGPPVLGLTAASFSREWEPEDGLSDIATKGMRP